MFCQRQTSLACCSLAATRSRFSSQPLLLAAFVAPSPRRRSWLRSNFDCCCAALWDRSRRIDETKVASCASLDLTGPNLILLQGLPDLPQNMRQSTSILLINHTLAVLSVFWCIFTIYHIIRKEKSYLYKSRHVLLAGSWQGGRHLGKTNLVWVAKPSAKILKLCLRKQDKNLLFLVIKYWTGEIGVCGPKMVLHIPNF